LDANDLLALVRDLDDEGRGAVLALIRKLEEDRKMVEINGRSVETTARNPKPETR
jgi:hypothetical protein